MLGLGYGYILAKTKTILKNLLQVSLWPVLSFHPHDCSLSWTSKS